MTRIRLVVIFTFMFVSTATFSQNKAVVLQNVWNNDLNSYNPQSFFDNILIFLKEKLSLTKIISDPSSLQLSRLDENWDKKIKDQIKERKSPTDSAYFIAITTELKLPVFNVGKLFFKNPPRSSKVIFSIHLYNASGTELLGDTIVNRGCKTYTVDEEKGRESFYPDYKSFNDDMQCHFQAIKQQLQDKFFTKKAKLYKET